MSGVPGLLPAQLLLIDEDTEHLQNGHGRVHLIEQYLVLLVELIHLILDILREAAHQVLKCGRRVEVFLAKAVLLMHLTWNVRVVYRREVLSVLDLVNFVDEIEHIVC